MQPKRFLALIIFIGIYQLLPAQNKPRADSLRIDGRVTINGEIHPFMIDDKGDTIILANLEEFSVTSFRSFNTTEDLSRYRRFREYALKVYPYAVEAIRIFRQVESLTHDMKNRQRKKYIKQLQQELNDKFRDPLTGLTRTQGMILFKMIEKELDTPIYDLIKNLRNGLTATYWQMLGNFYGHNLREGYIPGQDPILDAVLNDLNVSYNPSR